MTNPPSRVAPDVIDAHHHLWIRSQHPQSWIDPASMATIDRDFTVVDLAPLAGAAGVKQTVVVQSICSEAETIDLLRVAATSRLVSGVVGWVDPAADDVADRIAWLRAASGGDKLVGIRHLTQSEPDPGYLDRPDVRRGIAALASTGLAFDLVIREQQLPAAVRLARDLPEVLFVLDHLGKPALPVGRRGTWARDLGAFARLPNTAAKLSGLVTEADWSSWQPDDIRPAVEHALDVFGSQRLMFGSDWPVCLLAASYARWADVAAHLLAPLSEHDRAFVWARTARRVYGLKPP